MKNDLIDEKPQEAKCREAFEAWAKEHFTGNHWNLDRSSVENSVTYGKYLWVHVEEAWQAFHDGWKAGSRKS